MNAQNLIHGLLKALLIAFQLMGYQVSQAQKNPWETQVKGANPWAGQPTVTNSKRSHSQHVVDAQQADSTVVLFNQILANNSKLLPQQKASMQEFITRQSNDTVVYFNLGDSIVKLSVIDGQYKTLIKHGYHSHKARNAYGVGIATGCILNVFALPFNLVTSTLPSFKTRRIVKQFKSDNPHATKKEINALKLGIAGKRYARSATGVAIGSGAQLVFIAGVGILILVAAF